MKELPKAYIPSDYEHIVYDRWEASGFFNPDNLNGEPYSIMMPPPNVTGILHLGHALENSLMDLMARFQRMRGKKVLLLPGTDHAAVATQARVEKKLIENGIKNPREELGRKKLLEKIYEYSEQSKKTILKQIRKIGTSADWSRLAYTFDEERSKAVNTVFKKMYDDGLVYRGYRVVNWSVKGQSTCSDDELVHIERDAKLYTFKYSKDFPFSIATTRPETKLGDTAVAVNPKDERYKKYIGQTFTIKDFGQVGHSIILKVIADEHVEIDFGTGALGVTPAHSSVDFEMYECQKAKNNPIDLIQVIGIDGCMMQKAGESYAHLSVKEAREKFVKWLEKEELLESVEDIKQNVGTSDRFGDVVEALPMTQWFVDVNKEIPRKGKTLKQLMREAVSSGDVDIVPERFIKVYFNWIDNLRDWCISRQIWWGHQIPVYYCKGACQSVVSLEPIDMCPTCGKNIEQDPDTLDTWFSSGLWTFSTLGWPDEEKFEKMKIFHPTSFMQMGHEILFFWMARMILMSKYILDEVPFKKVYIHGMLRDKDGQKFSKSLGNGIDPLDVIEKYGTDALRWSLIGGVSPGNDSRFYLEKVEGARNFANKLWNVARFIIGKIDTDIKIDIEIPQTKTLADKWIFEKLNNVVKDITDDIEVFRFSQAGEKLRDFTWNELADWYLEVYKIQINNNDKNNELLNYILNTILKLWHPFMPFVTEAIWSSMYGEKNKDMLMVQKWPCEIVIRDRNFAILHFEIIQDIVVSIRSLRADYTIEPSKKITVVIVTKNNQELLEHNSDSIKGLAHIENLEISLDEKIKPKNSAGVVVKDISIYIDLAGAVDMQKEQKRLQKEIDKIEPYLYNLKKKLNDNNFVDHAPEVIVVAEKQKYTDMTKKLTALQIELHKLKK